MIIRARYVIVVSSSSSFFSFFLAFLLLCVFSPYCHSFVVVVVAFFSFLPHLFDDFAA
ncbi:uncharacterized protein DS421_5g160810 [Arachis hypogaea]|nr:uncharacterized protein DS421_5g160810 [Arachis hypogaea]